MKIMFVKFWKRKNEDNQVLMKDLRQKNFSDYFDEMKHNNLKMMHNIEENRLYKGIKKINGSRIIKKNQLALFAISLMLVTASYMNYSNNIRKNKKAKISSTSLVSTKVSEYKSDENDLNSEGDNTLNVAEDDQNLEQNDDYFSSVRLERDKSYSQMLETYTNILKDSNIPNDQKSIASNEIKKINDRKNQISTIENLLNGKGFMDSIIMINDNSIDAVIKSSHELDKKSVAQIEDIISRELDSKIENIHISTHE